LADSSATSDWQTLRFGATRISFLSHEWGTDALARMLTEPRLGVR
jgi:hypothetical protein